MKYQNIKSARFIERPNRFVARIAVGDGGEPVLCHVKNTGRCRELLPEGAQVWVQDHAANMGGRKLRYSLIAVKKKTAEGFMTVNMDSQAPNKLAKEALEQGVIGLEGLDALTVIRPETVKGDSRFDFYVKDQNGREGFIEVKGVTLEKDGLAAFPDAPTERGVKHIEGLTEAAEQGYFAAVIFVLTMEGMRCMVPNDKTHPAFGEALRRAAESGVRIIACECRVKPDELYITKQVPVVLGKEEKWV